jgi:hypothetical protein
MKFKYPFTFQLSALYNALENLPPHSPAFRQASCIISLLIFLVTFSVFAISPIRTPSDSRFAIHTSMSFTKGHGGDLSEYLPIIEKESSYSLEFRDGKPRSVYPIGTSLIAMPAVILIDIIKPDWADSLQNKIPGKQQKLIASLIAAIAAVLFFWVIFSRFKNVMTAIGVTAIFAFSTSMWSTATRALWQHGPLVLMLVITMLLLIKARQRPQLAALSALPLAMAYLIRPTAVVPIIVFSLYMLVYYRQFFLRYLLLAMLIAVPWIYFNISIYNWFLPPYYTANAFSQDTHFLQGLSGNLFSPSRGLFVFSPVLIFALSGFWVAWKDAATRPLHIAFALIITGHLIIVSCASMWWAGHSYGPRFTTDILPFLVYFTAYNFHLPVNTSNKIKKTILLTLSGLAVISALIHSQGAWSNMAYQWNVVPANIDLNPDRAWDWSDPQFLRAIPSAK